MIDLNSAEGYYQRGVALARASRFADAAVVTGCCGNGRLNNMHQLTPEITAPRGNASVLWVFDVPAAGNGDVPSRQ